jgi:subtilisin family serine protease
VIDTAAGVWSDPDNNPHGKAVGTLIRDTACMNSSNCKVDVRNYLGLPLLRDSINTFQDRAVIRRDTEHGGGFGAKGDIARAIVQAVDAAPADTPLVINLSVAYDTDVPMASLRPAVNDHSNNVVLEALQYARCHGALIFAAAGNGPVPADPTQRAAFPARWTGLNAPDTATCRTRYGFSHLANATQPLLYAVSAVDFGRKPLMTTRGLGQSVLAALGFAVVRKDPNGSYTRTLSGTSMATANASAIAAAYWSHLPDPWKISPDRIVRELYAASLPPISETPDFRPFRVRTAPQFFGNTRELTLCSIAQAGTTLATCVDSGFASTVPDGTLPDLPDNAATGELLPLADPPFGVDPWQIPYFRPQPDGEPACESCSIKLSTRRIELILRNSFSTSSSLRVLVRRSSSSGLARFAQNDITEEIVIPIAEFEALDDPFSVEVSDADLEGIESAELTYQVDVDDIPVDTTESIVIEAAPPPL